MKAVASFCGVFFFNLLLIHTEWFYLENAQIANDMKEQELHNGVLRWHIHQGASLPSKDIILYLPLALHPKLHLSFVHIAKKSFWQYK